MSRVCVRNRLEVGAGGSRRREVLVRDNRHKISGVADDASGDAIAGGVSDHTFHSEGTTHDCTLSEEAEDVAELREIVELDGDTGSELHSESGSGVVIGNGPRDKPLGSSSCIIGSDDAWSTGSVQDDVRERTLEVSNHVSSRQSLITRGVPGHDGGSGSMFLRFFVRSLSLLHSNLCSQALASLAPAFFSTPY